MLAVLPLFSLALLILISHRLFVKNNLSLNWREVILLAGVGWGVWLVFITEILGYFRLLHRYSLLVGWSLLILLSLWVLYRVPPRAKKIRLSDLATSANPLLGGILFIVITTGFIALLSPPNNWDSMTYHLSRVMHWAQNQSVAHYATHELRQLYQNPWAEYASLHLQILSGGDRLANLGQWFSMVGSIIGVSLIARQLGANLHGQLLAALATVTIPMGILQAVTTQNDYVVSFWLVCLVVFILSARQNLHWVYILGIAGSLGLALLTKGTAYLIAAPFVIWFGWWLLKKRGWQAWPPIFVIGLLVLLINSGHYARNLQLFGSPLKPQTLGQFDYNNQVFGPAVVISNVVRNIALHLDVLPSGLRVELEEGIERLHYFLRLDLNDPRTTWPGEPFTVSSFQVDENVSGNFLHLLLILAGFGVMVKQRRQPNAGLMFGYAALLIMALLLFAFYLKWQPWHSRLHLPLFVLWAPIIGWGLAQFPYRPILASGIALLLIIQALPFLLTNPLHPLLGPQNIVKQSRIEQYFRGNPVLQEPYRTATQLISQQQCNQVALILPVNAWEYPFWILLQESSTLPTRIEAVDVDNESAILQSAEFEPCAVICTRCSGAHKILYSEKFGAPALSYDSNLLFISNNEPSEYK